MASFEDVGPYLLERRRTAPPFMDFTVCALFACRALGGMLFGYGSVPVTVLSAVLAALYAARALTRLFFRERSAPTRSVGTADRLFLFLDPSVPFALMSTLGLVDYRICGGAALFAWPGLVIAAAFFNPLFLSFCFAAGTAVLFGLSALILSSGIATGSEQLFTLAAAVAISVGVFFSSRADALRAYGEARLRSEQERSISAARDAEVEIAARIQRSLLLDAPSVLPSGIRLEPVTVASQAVDGDLYGIVPYTLDSLDILIGDVMGKGVPAALLGAALKNAFLRASLPLLVKRPGHLPCPDELLSAVHEAVASDLAGLESFATVQYARVDIRNMRLDFVDCGHPAIIHYDSILDVAWALKGSDMPLGFSDLNSYSCYTVPLAVGDRLVFYSDGITEASNESGELFGEDRLSSIISSNASLSPSELVRRILNTALFFTVTAGFKDDVTCIALSLDSSERLPLRMTEVFLPIASSLGDIRSFIQRSMSGEIDDLVSRVVLAVAEAASNVLHHGYASLSASEPLGEDVGIVEEIYDSDGPEIAPAAEAFPAADDRLRIEYLRAEEWIAIRIIHKGIPFAWHLPVTVPDIGIMPEGGFGRSLMAQASDSVLYASGPGDLQMVCLFFNTVAWVGL